MLTVGELNWLLCDLHRAEREDRQKVPELKEAVLCAYEEALDELERLQRVSAWSRSRRTHWLLKGANR